MSSKRWADVEDNEEDFGALFDTDQAPPPDAAELPTVAPPKKSHAAIDTISSPLMFSFMKNRRVDHLVLMDLDTMKKGIGKVGYRLMTDEALSAIVVIMFRREVSRSHRSFVKQTCLSCKSDVSIPITSKVVNGRVLIEGTASALSTKYLMGFYGNYLAQLLCASRKEEKSEAHDKNETLGPQFTIVSADDGCQELATILKSSHAKVHSVRTEKSDSFDHLKALLPPLDPARHVVGKGKEERERKRVEGKQKRRETLTRSSAPRHWEPADDDPVPAGNLETVLKRVCEKFSATPSHTRPRTRHQLEKLLTPLCDLRGEIDPRSVLTVLREKHRVFSVCTDQCNKLSYHPSIRRKLSQDSSLSTAEDVSIDGDDSTSIACKRVYAELLSLAAAKKPLPADQGELLEFIRPIVNTHRSIAVEISDVIEVMIAKGVVRFEKDMHLTEKDYPAVYHLENLPRLREVRAKDLHSHVFSREGEETSRDEVPIAATSSAASSFAALKLHDSLVEGLRSIDITRPTDAQTQFFSLLSSKKTVLFNGRSGSGKTLAAVLYVLNLLLSLPNASSSNGAPVAVILCPFEPHAATINRKMVQPLAPKWLRVVSLLSSTDEHESLKTNTSGAVLLLAEPSRLEALVARRAVSLANVQVIVADDVDRLLPQFDMLKSIREAAAIRAQVIGLCSTRMRPQASGDDLQLFKRASKADDCQSALQANLSEVVPPRARHFVIQNADERRKLDALCELIRATERSPILVFVHPNRKVAELIATLRNERKISRKLRALSNTAAEFQNLQRDLAAGCTDVLIASGAALAYGVFFSDVKVAISLDLISPDVQIHISGRVANDWKDGSHLLLVSSKDQKTFDLLRDSFKLGFGESWKQILKF